MIETLGAREQRVAQALSLIERVVAAMCTHPDRLDMGVNIGNSMVRVTLTAHPDDGGRLVGEGGERIAELYAVAKLLFFGSGRTVRFEQIKKTKDSSEGYRKFKFEQDWDRDRVVTLTRDVASACFPGQRVSVATRDGKDGSIELTVGLEDLESERSKAFGKAIGVLLIPIGQTAGRIVYADIGPLEREAA